METTPDQQQQHRWFGRRKAALLAVSSISLLLIAMAIWMYDKRLAGDAPSPLSKPPDPSLDSAAPADQQVAASATVASSLTQNRWLVAALSVSAVVTVLAVMVAVMLLVYYMQAREEVAAMARVSELEAQLREAQQKVDSPSSGPPGQPAPINAGEKLEQEARSYVDLTMEWVQTRTWVTWTIFGSVLGAAMILMTVIHGLGDPALVGQGPLSVAAYAVVHTIVVSPVCFLGCLDKVFTWLKKNEGDFGLSTIRTVCYIVFAIASLPFCLLSWILSYLPFTLPFRQHLGHMPRAWYTGWSDLTFFQVHFEKLIAFGHSVSPPAPTTELVVGK